MIESLWASLKRAFQGDVPQALPPDAGAMKAATLARGRVRPAKTMPESLEEERGERSVPASLATNLARAAQTTLVATGFALVLSIASVLAFDRLPSRHLAQ